jgi:hypothetical protein
LNATVIQHRRKGNALIAYRIILGEDFKGRPVEIKRRPEAAIFIAG